MVRKAPAAGGSGHRGGLLAFAQELVDGSQHRLRVAQERRSGRPLQESQAGVRYPGGKAPGDVHAKPGELAAVKHQGRRPHLRQEGRNVELADGAVRPPVSVSWCDAFPHQRSVPVRRLPFRPPQQGMRHRLGVYLPVLVYQCAPPPELRGDRDQSDARAQVPTE